MQSVLEEVTAVEALAVETAAQREAARTRVAAARTQYSEAIAALRSAVEGLASGSKARADADSYLRGIVLADVPGRLDAAALRAADVWAAIDGRPSSTPPSAIFERFARAQADGTVIPAANRLSIRTKPVMHSAGKTVFSSEGTGTTDELPMRSLTLRTAGGPGYRGDWWLQGRDSRAGTQNTDGILNYSVQITPSGLVYKAGGNAIYYDFQRRFNVGSSVDAWWGLGPDGESGTDDDGAWSKGLDTPVNWIHDDIKITFGRPSDSSKGMNAFYWSTRVPFPEGTSWNDPNIVNKITSQDGVATAESDLGFYELWISNHAGVDSGLEYADGALHHDDDEDRFLQYAAHGLFVFTDELAGPVPNAPSRQQAFHFGYDTFADEDKLRTTDIASGNTVEATFRGATTAMQQLRVNTQHPNRHEIRGDITLNARIGSGANKISGEITNLEKRGSDGSWRIFEPLVNDQARLLLTGKDFPRATAAQVDNPNTDEDETGNAIASYNPSNYSAYAADISADGSYEGGVFLLYWEQYTKVWSERSWEFDSYRNDGTLPWVNSIFGGTIYGPRDDDFENIETAGYWYLGGDKSVDRWGGIIGSYGAVRTE